MPSSRAKKSLSGFGAALALAPSALAGESGTAAEYFSDGLLTQLFYLPAGLLLAAVVLEVISRRRHEPSTSLQSGILAVLAIASLGAIAALTLSWLQPELAAGLSGSPFVSLPVGGAVTGLAALCWITKRLWLRAPAPKPRKKRGRGRGRRGQRSGTPIRPILGTSYGLCLTAAAASIIASPFFIEPESPVPTALAEQAGPPAEPETSPEPGPELEEPVVVAKPSPEANPQPEPKLAPEQEMEPETTPEPEMVAQQPEPEPEMAPIQPETETVTVASVTPIPSRPDPPVRRVVTERGGLAGAETYKNIIQPLFRSRCYDCHGEEKQKGDLRLDTPEWIRKGGKSGAVIVAGDVDKSYLYELISLDPSDDDVMPPKGKPLSDSQIAWVAGWIREGAALGDGVDWPVREGGDASEFAIDSLGGSVPDADGDVVQSLLNGGVIVRELSSDGRLLEVDFSHAGRPAGGLQLDQLAPIAANIHTLDLKNTKVNDADLAILSEMTNLRFLHLQRTAITDAALPHLSSLTELESLNLYDTKVSDAGIPELKKLTSLKKIYLWSTEVTADGARDLASVLGADVVNRGE